MIVTGNPTPEDGKLYLENDWEKGRENKIGTGHLNVKWWGNAVKNDEGDRTQAVRHGRGNKARRRGRHGSKIRSMEVTH